MNNDHVLKQDTEVSTYLLVIYDFDKNIIDILLIIILLFLFRPYLIDKSLYIHLLNYMS